MPSVLSNLTGHSHGNAGITTALCELYAFTNDAQFHDAAYEELKYERYHYNSEERNWPDFRLGPKGDPTGKPKYPSCWCHGAAGIALSRMRCFELTKDHQILEELNIAIDTTISRSSFLNRSNASLYHGVLGNSVILLYAGLSLEDDWLVNFLIDNGHGGIRKHYDRHVPWMNGIHDKEYIPELMLGFAGFGYAYLRFFKPKEVPMVMLIHPDERF